jgi:predicted GH43/DUF377 family glycosyl hydrolase
VDKDSWKRFETPFIPAVSGTWKSRYTANADLVDFGDKYLMYYRGTDERFDQIGVMSCSKEKFDGIHWEDYPFNPIIKNGLSGSCDSRGVIDPSAILHKGKIFLYYSAFGDEADTIGLATSEDGFRFEKWSDNPVLIGRCPEIVVHNNGFYLFFVRENELGGFSIYAALSGEGIRYSVLDEPVLIPGLRDAWDSKSVTTPRIFKEGNLWYMVYAGDDRTQDDSWRFGLAVSGDLLHWKKYEGNPIFQHGPLGAWDDTCIWFGTTEKVNGRYWMWYEACNSRRGFPDFISATGAACLDVPYFFIKPDCPGITAQAAGVQNILNR